MDEKIIKVSSSSLNLLRDNDNEAIITKDDQHEYRSDEKMSDDDDGNNKENIAPSTLNNHPPSDDATDRDRLSINGGGGSTGKQMRHRRHHPMSEREMNIIYNCHSSYKSQLQPQQLSCQLSHHQQQHYVDYAQHHQQQQQVSIDDTDSCSAKVRRVLWKEGVVTPYDDYNNNNDEPPQMQLFPKVVRTDSNEIQQLTKERDELLSLVVELQELRRYDAKAMQSQHEELNRIKDLHQSKIDCLQLEYESSIVTLRTELQSSLTQNNQLCYELNKQKETSYQEDSKCLCLDMKVTAAAAAAATELVNADTSFHDTTTVRLMEENSKVLELNNSELVNEIKQLTSSLNAVVEQNNVLQLRMEGSSVAYNELLQENVVSEEKHCRLLNS